MKILYITPHLSTGGLPQYLLKKIQYYLPFNEIYIVEWQNITGGVFVVQRNQIEQLLMNNFYSLDENKDKIFDIIQSIQPNIIHFEELPETFISFDILNKIYSNDRNYNIVCTTHSSFSKPEKLHFGADKFVLVSEWSRKVFSSYFENIDCDIWEYPIEKQVYDKQLAKKTLGFDDGYKHVLNVGLFTPGKNQKELIDLAKSCLKYKIKFHFVGNQAMNFEDYWKPLMLDLPSNCIIHGERNDVDIFYKAADVFYFTSNLELNPLVVKEALSYDLKVFIKKLHTYENSYDDLVTYITTDQNKNLQNLIDYLQPEYFKSDIRILHNLIDIDDNREKLSIASVSKLANNFEYIQCINKKYVGDDWKKQQPLEGWMNHGPGHYGCFDSMKKAILNYFTEDYKAVLICEADCIIDIDKDKFVELVNKALALADKHQIPYVSFSPRFIDGSLISVNTGEDDCFDDFIFTKKIIQTHCFLLTKHFKSHLLNMLNTSWGTPDLWFNIVWKDHKMAICRDEITHQEEGLSMIDSYNKGYSIKKNTNGKLHLIFSTARRLHYFKQTFNSLFAHNPELKTLVCKTWLFDDRSTDKDRNEMNDLLRSTLSDNFNSIYFNKNDKLSFIDKFNFMKKVVDKNDYILFIEDDWLCLKNLNIAAHLNKIKNSNWTQIAFADCLDIQEKYIKDNYRLNNLYWKNPWPNDYKHIYKIEDSTSYFSIVRMNNWTNNPSLIQASVLFERDFEYTKNFEAVFADFTTRNQYFTNELMFKHIGVESLIDKI